MANNNLNFDLNTIDKPTYITCHNKRVALNFIQKFMDVDHTEKDLFDGAVLHYYNPAKETHLKITTMYYPTLGRYELFAEPTGPVEPPIIDCGEGNGEASPDVDFLAYYILSSN